MDLLGVRELAKTTLYAACPDFAEAEAEDGAVRVFTTPKLTFEAISPTATIETQESATIYAARKLYTLDYTLAIFIHAKVAIKDQPPPPGTEQFAEDLVTTIVLQAVPALKAAKFEVHDVSFVPRSSPWRRIDADIYRWAMIPVVYHDEYGYEET